MLSISMVGSLARLEVFSENMRQVKFTVEGLEEYLEMPELPEPAARAEVSHMDVELKNVRFSYTGDDKDEVLHGVNLKLPEGSFTALVGPSGGGKSTVAKLIARFWDVTDGAITIGGVNVFTSIKMITGGKPMHQTETVLTWMYYKAFNTGSFGYAAALSFVVAVTLIFLAVLQFRAMKQKDAANS